MSEIQLATVLIGATSFDEGNINDTFRGQVLTSDSETHQAIIKDLDLIQLCNELLACCLARTIGLPIPESFLGIVRPGVLNVSKAPLLQDGSRLVFVSVDVKVPNVTYRWCGSDTDGKKALLDEVTKWSDLGNLYAYDTWIANVDRHMGNLLFGGKGEFWLIDHGHSFTGPNWKPDQLNPEGEYMNRLSEWVTIFLSLDQKKQRATEVRKFGLHIDGFDASEVSKNSRINDLLPLQTAAALKEFLENRTSKVSAHASKALGVPTMI
ncbi:MAG: HipA family kinase [Rhodobacterales bacterium]|tara:strand:+ start:670 stop:1467 length:798 start_codon:yes stop_codon:yes gene_type:complete